MNDAFLSNFPVWQITVVYISEQHTYNFSYSLSSPRQSPPILIARFPTLHSIYDVNETEYMYYNVTIWRQGWVLKDWSLNLHLW